MKTIQFSSWHLSNPAPLFRQTPKNEGIWGDLQFGLQDFNADAEWLVVYDRHAEPLVTKVPKDRRILMVSEPPEFQNYPQAYLDQFGTLIAPYEIINFKGRQIIGQTALPWFYGMDVGGGGELRVSKYWSDLQQPTPPIKGRPWEITAICSTKTQTKNQIRRLRFLRILKAELGDRLKIFGRGFEALDDKAEVIEKSRYHLALENNLLPHGWTEKTADPILGGAFPIHGGAKQIEADFDPDGLLWIDMTRPYESVRKIKECLDSHTAVSEISQKAMLANKKRLMNEHNLFSVIKNLVHTLDSESGKCPSLSEPEPLVWHKKSALQRILKLPRPLRRLIWQTSIAIQERN